MPDSAPIFTQLTLTVPHFVKNFYIELNENQANCTITDKRSWTDVVKKKIFFATS